jgi:hypothetical protein
MDTLRVSASDIDSLRYFRNDEEADFAVFLADLRRENEPSPSMLAGTALHKALELAEPGEVETLKVDGYSFKIEADAEIDLPSIREIKSTMEFVVDDCRVTLVGKVDAIHGTRVVDHKFTTRFDPEKFMESYQWRSYLTVFGADVFNWNVFEARETGPKTYVVHTVHKLTMHRYPGMRDDLLIEIGKFVQFARAHLPERFGKMAA